LDAIAISLMQDLPGPHGVKEDKGNLRAVLEWITPQVHFNVRSNSVEFLAFYRFFGRFAFSYPPITLLFTL
jgi:hypothetical protein